MRQGFFNLTELSVSNNTATLPRCGLCGLSHGCHSPRMKPTGKGKRKVLVVAEAPVALEDLKGKQLIGEAGQVFRNLLRSIGVDLDRDCWKTNSVVCRPPNNKTPTEKQIESCRPNLLHAIKTLKPHTVILLGMSAVKSLVPVVWKEGVGNGLGKWVGWNIPSQKLNVWICPTYHPSYLLRTHNDLLKKIMTGHLKRAFRHKSRPWKEEPNYKDRIEVITKPAQAAKVIKEMIRNGSCVVPDFETNCIKPEEEESEIICCSLCQEGKRTIVYPWVGEAVDATVQLFKSPVPKIGANIKFEDRWSRRKLGVGIRGWYWDTMLASHVLDNRAGITSVKFQSFVRLGVEGYDSHIKPYLQSSGKKRLNRIKELPIMDVLLYCGMDSLVEWEIFRSQQKEMEREFS
ncbi:MAG: uracil-DNA glycosylase family protein [Dehalococcoidales bacterium]